MDGPREKLTDWCERLAALREARDRAMASLAAAEAAWSEADRAYSDALRQCAEEEAHRCFTGAKTIDAAS